MTFIEEVGDAAIILAGGSSLPVLFDARLAASTMSSSLPQRAAKILRRWVWQNVRHFAHISLIALDLAVANSYSPFLVGKVGVGREWRNWQTH